MAARALAAKRRARVAAICCALPEVAALEAAGHLKFEVRGRTVAWYLDNHHGDGLVALCVKAPPGEHTRLVRAQPDRYYLPAYMGPRGWVALRIDLPRIDWGEVERLVGESYQLTAPRRLAAAARAARA